jgi:hypothetical protein
MRHVNLLSTAIAGLLAAGAAHAVTPATVPSNNRLYVSGATATDNALSALFLRDSSGSVPRICAPGTIDMYVDGTDATKAKNRMILCTLESQINDSTGNKSIAAGQNIAILKESNGGSDRGTAYVADASFLDFRSMSDVSECATGTSQGAGTITSFPGHQTFNLHVNCTHVESVRTQTGIADVDPALFTVGTAPVSQDQIDRLQVDSLYQPMFAAAVSLNLYRALQRAQGITLTGTQTDDDEAHMPTMTKAQIAGLFADGGVRDWRRVTNSAGTAVNNAAFTNGATVPNLVYVCRRGDESGTQASAAEYFLNERCGKGTNGFKLKTGVSDQQNGTAFTSPTISGGVVTNVGSTGDEVWAGKGSGDVRACLDGHNDVNHFAIGLLGSESVYDNFGGTGGLAGAAAGAAQWRYVAINGLKPNLKEVATGRYDFVMENVLNMRTQTVSGVAPIDNEPLVLHDYIKTSFASLDVIASLLVKTLPHGYTGGLAGSTHATPNAIPVTNGNLDTNPVSAFTKSPLGPVNNCGNAFPLRATATN